MRRKEFNLDETLSLVMALFWEHGYEGVSLADIEKATGVGKKSLYNQLGGKDEIFNAALNLYLEKMLGGAKCLLANEPLGISNIKQMFSYMKYEPESDGCLMTKTINSRTLVPEKSIETISEQLTEVEELYYKNVLASSGDKKKSRRLAQFLTSSVQGITTMAKLDPNPKRLRNIIETLCKTLDHEIENED